MHALQILFVILIYAGVLSLFVLIMRSWWGDQFKYALSLFWQLGGKISQVVRVLFSAFKATIGFLFELGGKAFHVGTVATETGHKLHINRRERKSEIMALVADAWGKAKTGDKTGEKELLVLKSKYGKKAVRQALKDVQDYDNKDLCVGDSRFSRIWQLAGKISQVVEKMVKRLLDKR